MPVCGKSLSFAQPLQSPCPGSGHFQPQKSSLSPPEVASSAPQSGHLEAKTTVGNLKNTARKKENRGKMPSLPHKKRGRKSVVLPRNACCATLERQAEPPFPPFSGASPAFAPVSGLSRRFRSVGRVQGARLPALRRSPSFRAAAQGQREKRGNPPASETSPVRAFWLF